MSKSGWTIAHDYVVAESTKRGVDRAAFNEMFSWVKANARREGIGAILSHKLGPRLPQRQGALPSLVCVVSDSVGRKTL